jgi:hypothetical protein
MDNISLELSFTKQEFIQGESIPFTVVLKNVSGESLLLNSFDAKNQSVSLVAEGKSSEKIGTQMSWKERDGIHIDDPRQYKEFEVGPHKSKQLNGDGIEWLGDLPPGEYEMYAAYNSGVNIYVESERVIIKIEPGKAVYHKSVKSNIKLAYALTRTTWLNQVSDGFDLYLLESSPNFPSNTYRNWKVFNLKNKEQVFPASANTDPAKIIHLCWLDENNELNLLSVSEEQKPGKLQKHRLNLADAVILESPFSDQFGNFYVIIANKVGTEIVFVRIESEGKIEKSILLNLKNSIRSYSILWDRDEILHLVWNENYDSKINCLNVELNKPFKPIIPNQLCSLDSKIAGLEIYQTDSPTDKGYEEQLSVLKFDEVKGLWQRWYVNLQKPEPIIVETLKGVTSSSYSLFSSALTVDNEPVYLFMQNNREIYYYSSIGKTLEPLAGLSGKVLKDDSQPELITTAQFSHRPGVYVRYISKQNDFKYVKVE